MLYRGEKKKCTVEERRSVLWRREEVCCGGEKKCAVKERRSVLYRREEVCCRGQMTARRKNWDGPPRVTMAKRVMTAGEGLGTNEGWESVGWKDGMNCYSLVLL